MALIFTDSMPSPEALIPVNLVSSEQELRALMGSYSGCCVAAGAILRGSLHAGMLPVKPHLAAGSVERLERVCCSTLTGRGVWHVCTQHRGRAGTQ